MDNSGVITCTQIDKLALTGLLERYQLQLSYINAGQEIPGSFWGDSEAGLIGNTLYVRADTPAHSLLHEASHYICMSPGRRQDLDTNAGGDYDEENAVCYLQILLAPYLPPLTHKRLMADMDLWGYSFRLGSASRWFHEDAKDARLWLQEYGLIDENLLPTWELRQ